MNRFIYFLLFFIFSLPIQSCRKAVHKEVADFVGHWYHRDTNGEGWYIEIDEKSWGNISVYDSEGNYTDKYHYGENPHQWRYNEKRQMLTHGIISERFKVNQLPTVAEATIISGYDTITAGRTYCIIKDDYYLKAD